MIKVEVEYKGKGFHSLLIKGHANTGDYGKDLVCAGVSAVSIGAMNALSDPEDDFEIDEVSYPQAIDIKEREI